MPQAEGAGFAGFRAGAAEGLLAAGEQLSDSSFKFPRAPTLA